MVVKPREQPMEKMHASKEGKMHFTFSDTISGNVTTADQDAKTFSMKTSYGQEFQVRLTSTTYMEVLRNLGEEVAAGFQQALHGSSRVLANGTPYLTGTER